MPPGVGAAPAQASEGVQAPAGARVPDPDRAVEAAGGQQQPTVTPAAPLRRADGVSVPGEGAQYPAGAGVPDPGDPVGRPGGQQQPPLGIGGPRDPVDVRGGAVPGPDLGERGQHGGDRLPREPGEPARPQVPARRRRPPGNGGGVRGGPAPDGAGAGCHLSRHHAARSGWRSPDRRRPSTARSTAPPRGRRPPGQEPPDGPPHARGRHGGRRPGRSAGCRTARRTPRRTDRPACPGAR